jgi:hypothetical protein
MKASMTAAGQTPQGRNFYTQNRNRGGTVNRDGPVDASGHGGASRSPYSAVDFAQDEPTRLDEM